MENKTKILVGLGLLGLTYLIIKKNKKAISSTKGNKYVKI